MDGHTLNQFCNRRRISALQQLAIVIFAAIAILICDSRISESATYTRSTTIGTWSDGNWTPSSGLIDGAPIYTPYSTSDLVVLWGPANAPISVDVTADQHVYNIEFYAGATLNLKAGLFKVDHLQLNPGSTINQNGGDYSIDSLVLIGSAQLPSNGMDHVNHHFSLARGASMTLDADISKDNMSFGLTNSTLNLNGHSLSVAKILGLGSNSKIDRGNNGSMSIGDLDIYDGVDWTFSPSDTFHLHSSVMIRLNSSLTVASPINGGIWLENNSKFSTDSPVTGGGITVYTGSRFMSTNDLDINGFGVMNAPFNPPSPGSKLTARDVISTSMCRIDDNAEVNLRSLNIGEQGSLYVEGYSSLVVQGELIAPLIQVSSSTLSVRGNLTTTNNSRLTITDSSVTLNGNLTSKTVEVRAGTSLNISGSANISTLRIDSSVPFGYRSPDITNLTATLSITGDATCNNVFMSKGSVLNLTQLDDALTGLTVEWQSYTFNGVTNLKFDSTIIPGQLDWAFRLGGHNVEYLTERLGSNFNIFGAPQPVSVIYDPALYGDYTYIGYIAAVPEPGMLLLVGIVSTYILICCNRRKNETTDQK